MRESRITKYTSMCPLPCTSFHSKLSANPHFVATPGGRILQPLARGADLQNQPSLVAGVPEGFVSSLGTGAGLSSPGIIDMALASRVFAQLISLWLPTRSSMDYKTISQIAGSANSTNRQLQSAVAAREVSARLSSWRETGARHPDRQTHVTGVIRVTFVKARSPSHAVHTPAYLRHRQSENRIIVTHISESPRNCLSAVSVSGVITTKAPSPAWSVVDCSMYTSPAPFLGIEHVTPPESCDLRDAQIRIGHHGCQCDVHPVAFETKFPPSQTSLPSTLGD